MNTPEKLKKHLNKLTDKFMLGNAMIAKVNFDKIFFIKKILKLYLILNFKVKREEK